MQIFRGEERASAPSNGNMSLAAGNPDCCEEKRVKENPQAESECAEKIEEDQPIKISQIDDHESEIVNTENFVESQLSADRKDGPKDFKGIPTSQFVLDGSPLDHEELGLHGVEGHYMIKVPRFYDGELHTKLQLARSQLNEKTQIRNSIAGEVYNKKAAHREYREKWEAARVEERAGRAAVSAKHKELDSVQSKINQMNSASSVVEMSDKIYKMEHSLQHETIPLTLEKQYIRDIKQLRQRCDQFSAKMGLQEQINMALDNRNQIEEQLKILKKELGSLQAVSLQAESNAKAAWNKYNAEFQLLRDLQEKIRLADWDRQAAYDHMQNLKNELTKKNKYLNTYIDDRNIAANYASARDKEGLQCHCNKQVEKIMNLWNKNDEFRKEYVKSNVNNTLRRLGSIDGRSLGPHEKPHKMPGFYRKPNSGHLHSSQDNGTIHDLVPNMVIPGKSIASPTTTKHLEELKGEEGELRKKQTADELKEQHHLEQEAVKSKRGLDAEETKANAEYETQKEVENSEKKRAKRKKKKKTRSTELINETLDRDKEVGEAGIEIKQTKERDELGRDVEELQRKEEVTRKLEELERNEELWNKQVEDKLIEQHQLELKAKAKDGEERENLESVEELASKEELKRTEEEELRKEQVADELKEHLLEQEAEKRENQESVEELASKEELKRIEEEELRKEQVTNELKERHLLELEAEERENQESIEELASKEELKRREEEELRKKQVADELKEQHLLEQEAEERENQESVEELASKEELKRREDEEFRKKQVADELKEHLPEQEAQERKIHLDAEEAQAKDEYESQNETENWEMKKSKKKHKKKSESTQLTSRTNKEDHASFVDVVVSEKLTFSKKILDAVISYEEEVEKARNETWEAEELIRKAEEEELKQNKRATNNRQKKRTKKKQKNKYTESAKEGKAKRETWMLLLVISLLVVILFLVGNYSSIPNFSLPNREL